MNVEHLLQRVTACGYRVELANGSPALHPDRGECVMPKPLLEALKANRDAVVGYLTRVEACSVCGREVTAEDRPHLVDPAVCERGGAGHKVRRTGNWIEDAERCPYKPNQNP